MRASVLALLVAAFAVNTIALPTGDNTEPQNSCPSAPSPTGGSGSGGDTPTPTGGSGSPTGGPGTPTGGSGSTPTAYPADCTYTCSRPAVAAVLNCVNVLTGLSVDVPVSALNPPTPKEKRTGPAPVPGNINYCCKTSPAVVSALTCVDIASGSEISIPISLLNG